MNPNAIAVFQREHHTPIVPSLEDWQQEQHTALKAIAGYVNDLGIDETVLATAGQDDLSLFLIASHYMENISSWVRCDALGKILENLGVDSVTYLKEDYPRIYKEIESMSGASLGTLQNDWTTYQCWPKALRSAETSYSVHRALNPIPSTERAVWLLSACSERWSKATTIAKVKEYMSEERPEDEERYRKLDRHIVEWSSRLDASLSLSDRTLEIHKEGHSLTIEAHIKPSGLPGLRVKEQ